MNYFIGIDEAGRGPWAGPVVVGGFLVQAEKSAQIFRELPKLDDSKKLTEKDRESLFHDIERLQFEQECQYAFAYRDANMIDILGIREANRQSMQDVILSLLQFVSQEDTLEIWIDGCDNYRFDNFDGEYVFAKKKRGVEKNEKVESYMVVIPTIGGICPRSNTEQILRSSEGQKLLKHRLLQPREGQEQLKQDSSSVGMTKGKKISYVIHGDSLVPAISAASIIAKVLRDKMMCEFHEDFPEYGFADHKGYGTKQHQEALLNHGITSIHRKSYAPVKRLISTDSSV